MIGSWGGILEAAACLASICGIGCVLARLLRAGEPADARSARPSLGWSFLIGSAAVGLALQIPLAIDGTITHRSFAAVGIAGLAAFICCMANGWRNTAPPRGLPWGWLGDLPMLGRLLAVVALPAAAVYCCRTDLSGYDARSIYALKARVLYDSGTIRGEDFQDIQRVHFNPSYPLLLSLIEAEMYWMQGGFAATGLKLLFLVFPLALVSVYASQLRRFGGRSLAAMLALMLLLTPVILECFEGAGLSGSADLPLAALVFAGVLEIARCIRRPGWRPAVCAALLLAAAVSTKSEGVIWVAACVAGLAATWLLRPAWPTRLQLAIGMGGGTLLLLLVGLRQAILHQLPDSPYYPSYYAALDWHWIRQLGARPAIVLRYGLIELVRTKFWNLMWPCVLCSLVLLRRGRLPAAVLFWRLTIVAGVCGTLLALVITPLHVEYELRTSFTRLMLHAFPLAALIMAEQWSASGWSGQLEEAMRADEPIAAPAEQDLAEPQSRAA